MEQSLDLLWFLAFSEKIFTVVSSYLCNSGLASRAHSEFTLVLSQDPFQSHTKWFKDSLAKLTLNWAFPALTLTDTKIALTWSLMKETSRKVLDTVSSMLTGMILMGSEPKCIRRPFHPWITHCTWVRERCSHSHHLQLCLCKKTHNLLLKQSKIQNDKDKTYYFHVGLIYPCKL